MAVNNNTFITSDNDGKIKFFKYPDLNVINEFEAHCDKITKLFYNDKMILSCSENGEIKIHDINSIKFLI